MTYREKLEEITRELENLTEEECWDIYNESNWSLNGVSGESILKCGIEWGLERALKIAEEYKVNKEI